MQEIGVRSPGTTDQSRSKTGSDDFNAKRSPTDARSRVLGEEHYKRITLVTIGVARLKTLNA